MVVFIVAKEITNFYSFSRDRLLRKQKKSLPELFYAPSCNFQAARENTPKSCEMQSNSRKSPFQTYFYFYHLLFLILPFLVFNRVDKEEDPVKKNVAENLRHKKTLKTIAKCMQKFTKLQLHLNNLSWSLSIRNQSAEKKGTQQESLILTIMDEELCGAIISKEVKSSGQNNCIFFIHSHFFSFT